MKRALLPVLFALLAACGVDPVADCESQCEVAIQNGCRPAGTTDCMAECMGIQEVYDRDRASAVVAMCQGEFDSVYGCFAGGDPCDTSRCQSEVNASVECFTEFCTSVPTSPVCSGRP